MRTAAKTTGRRHRIMGRVRQRIERGGERLWRFEDFRDLSFSAVAQALSHLTREGSIERLSKGVYYRNRDTRLRFAAWHHDERCFFRPGWPPPISWALPLKCRDRVRLPPVLSVCRESWLETKP
jgi:hypothetical protein